MTAFATHGDLLKLLYAAFGVLPRKEARFEEFDETRKKTLQTRLSRLASESGGLVDNYRQAIESFRDLLGKYLTTPGHVDALGIALADLDDVYAGMIRDEGTYLDRRASLEYFISLRAVPVFVLSLNRNLLLWNAYQPGGMWDDDVFWYLPTRALDGKLVMPLAKVMRWIYGRFGISQNQFHYPRTANAQPSAALEQNLDNAVRWVSGKRLPSLPALLANFKESFAARQAHGRPVDSALEERILTALVFARLASYLATELRDHCGDAYLDDVCAQIRESMVLLQHEVQEFQREAAPIIQSNAPADQAAAWWVACAHHEKFVREKLTVAAETLHRLHEAAPNRPFRADVLAALTSKLGAFAVCTNVDRWRRQQAIGVPQGFAELLFAGADMRRLPGTTLAQIDEFEQRIQVAGLQEAMCWMPPWLRGAFYYRREDFVTAFGHYETAFNLAKYRAGRYQYTLVNQYVELACKNDDEVAIRQGIDWATYIGLELRWLRDNDHTPDNLDVMRAILKKANYAHQL